jgi:putative oxidoreductase
LVQFALLGSSDLEQCAILLVRVSFRLFFAISGANKLVAGGTKPAYETLVKTKSRSHQMAYIVSGVEFVAGSLVTAGFFRARPAWLY